MSEPKSRTDFLKAIRARTSALKIQTEIPEDIRRASISNVHQQIENSISKAIVPGNYLLPSSAFHEQDPDGTTEQETGDMFVDEDFDDVLLQAEEEDEEPPLRSNSSSDLYINGVYYPLHEWMGADFVRHIVSPTIPPCERESVWLTKVPARATQHHRYRPASLPGHAGTPASADWRG